VEYWEGLGLGHMYLEGKREEMGHTHAYAHLFGTTTTTTTEEMHVYNFLIYYYHCYKADWSGGQ